MWSYSRVTSSLTNAYAACAWGENLAIAVRGPSSIPTVMRTTRSSLLTPETVKDTDSCSAASVASAARHLRDAPRRGRSCTCTTTVSFSTAHSLVFALRSMVMPPCSCPGENLPHSRGVSRTRLAVSYAVVGGPLRQVLPVSCVARPRSSDALAQTAKPASRGAHHLSGRVPLLLLGRRLGDRGGGERDERAEGVGGHLGGEQVRLGDLAVDLLAVDRDLARGLEAQPDRAPADLDDVDLDVVADADGLADAAGESEHWNPSMGVVGRPWQARRSGPGAVSAPPYIVIGAGDAGSD